MAAVATDVNVSLDYGQRFGAQYAIGRMTGVLQGAEAYQGYDVWSGRFLNRNEVWDRSTEAGVRLGATATTVGLWGRTTLTASTTVSAQRTIASADLRILNPQFQLDPTKVVGSENAYSAGFRTTLPPTAYPGKPHGFHFQQANRQLIGAMDADPRFAQQIDSLIPGVRGQLVKPRSFSREPPVGWTWHHHADTGVLELVPRVQHEAAGPLQQLFHPGGQGGMNNWGK